MSNLDKTAAFIEAEAEVRYWEDATINGVEDEDGCLVPLRVKDAWCPTIDLRTGKVVGWPAGTEASIHYKVCDAGRYWLMDEEGNRIATTDGYVPANMCHGSEGWGDYIIMSIGQDGAIKDFHREPIEDDAWDAIP